VYDLEPQLQRQKFVAVDDLIKPFSMQCLQLSGGRISWRVPLGRKDGLVSTAASTNGKLPPPTASVALLKSIFAGVGLSTAQMVTLSGEHMHYTRIWHKGAKLPQCKLRMQFKLFEF
jgi:hypothetical protein